MSEEEGLEQIALKFTEKMRHATEEQRMGVVVSLLRVDWAADLLREIFNSPKEREQLVAIDLLIERGFSAAAKALMACLAVFKRDRNDPPWPAFARVRNNSERDTALVIGRPFEAGREDEGYLFVAADLWFEGTPTLSLNLEGVKELIAKLQALATAMRAMPQTQRAEELVNEFLEASDQIDTHPDQFLRAMSGLQELDPALRSRAVQEMVDRMFRDE